ncbi:MAG TPA: hypothetical protein VJM34_00415 [Novosphingobium sp.]|nr:hypothetical protein [Novosphingobium sp.]
MRTRLGICRRKQPFASEEAALRIAAQAPFPLRPYRCELCRQFHLTSRTKGLRLPRFEAGTQEVRKPPYNVVKTAPKSLPPLPASLNAS